MVGGLVPRRVRSALLLIARWLSGPVTDPTVMGGQVAPFKAPARRDCSSGRPLPQDSV